MAQECCSTDEKEIQQKAVVNKPKVMTNTIMKMVMNTAMKKNIQQAGKAICLYCLRLQSY